jgi:predicted nucleic acid-binding protein
MTGRVLLDSNVLVYAADASEREKQRRAIAVLHGILRAERGILSTQVLGEFFRVATERLRPALTRAEGHLRVALLVDTWPVLPITRAVVLEAARGARDHGLPYWDAQIWATARLNQIDTVLSEDFQDGRSLDGVRFVNPFAPPFDLAALLT